MGMPAKAEETVKGNEVHFVNEADTPLGKLKIAYLGNIDGNNMRGQRKINEYPAGTGLQSKNNHRSLHVMKAKHDFVYRPALWDFQNNSAGIPRVLHGNEWRGIQRRSSNHRSRVGFG